MKITLYEMTNDIAEILDIPMEEMTEEDKTQLIEMVFDMIKNKSEGIIEVIRNFETRIKAVKEEEKRLAEYRKSEEKKLEKLKEYTIKCLQTAGIDKLDTTRGKISIRKSPASLNITNADLIPAIYKSTEEVVKIDNATIKSFLQKGHSIEGAELITTNCSLMIK